MQASWCFPGGRKGNPVKFRGCPRSCKVVSCLEGGQIFSVKPLDRIREGEKMTSQKTCRTTRMINTFGGKEMNGLVRLLCFLCACGVFCCCKSGTGKKSAEKQAVQVGKDSIPRVQIKYAKGFWLEYREGYAVLNIKDPQESSHTHYQYALIPRGTKVQTPAELPVVEIPVRSVVCMTSLQLSNFIKLEAIDKVVGITSTRFLFNEGMQQRVDEGKTRRIGIEGNFDNEVIMSLNPDLMLISPFKRGGYDAVKDIGIPLVPHLGYKEMTPLGQAEWIKFVGLLLGMEDKANGEFDRIEGRYNSLKALVGEVKRRPVVFSGELRGGVWYAVGGKSFLAQLFHDAGADYFLKDDPRSGGVTLDFETVYNQAESADYWRIANSFAGEYCYDALKAQDERYADFKAFRDKRVVYCNMREKPFYESMPAEPEVVLADMIRVFHPEILPDHEPVYYDLLKK